MRIPASTPTQLSALIQQIKIYEEKGILEDQKHENGDELELLKNINSEGPWPDFILVKIECTSCKRRYKLVANTYQGSIHNGWSEE